MDAKSITKPLLLFIFSFFRVKEAWSFQSRNNLTIHPCSILFDWCPMWTWDMVHAMLYKASLIYSSKERVVYKFQKASMFMCVCVAVKILWMFRRMPRTGNTMDAQERVFENKSNEGVRMIAAMCPSTKRLREIFAQHEGHLGKVYPTVGINSWNKLKQIRSIYIWRRLDITWVAKDERIQVQGCVNGFLWH